MTKSAFRVLGFLALMLVGSSSQAQDDCSMHTASLNNIPKDIYLFFDISSSITDDGEIKALSDMVKEVFSDGRFLSSSDTVHLYEFSEDCRSVGEYSDNQISTLLDDLSRYSNDGVIKEFQRRKGKGESDYRNIFKKIKGVCDDWKKSEGKSKRIIFIIGSDLYHYSVQKDVTIDSAIKSLDEHVAMFKDNSPSDKSAKPMFFMYALKVDSVKDEEEVDLTPRLKKYFNAIVQEEEENKEQNKNELRFDKNKLITKVGKHITEWISVKNLVIERSHLSLSYENPNDFPICINEIEVSDGRSGKSESKSIDKGVRAEGTIHIPIDDKIEKIIELAKQGDDSGIFFRIKQSPSPSWGSPMEFKVDLKNRVDILSAKATLSPTRERGYRVIGELDLGNYMNRGVQGIEFKIYLSSKEVSRCETEFFPSEKQSVYHYNIDFKKDNVELPRDPKELVITARVGAVVSRDFQVKKGVLIWQEKMIPAINAGFALIVTVVAYFRRKKNIFDAVLASSGISGFLIPCGFVSFLFNLVVAYSVNFTDWFVNHSGWVFYGLPWLTALTAGGAVSLWTHGKIDCKLIEFAAGDETISLRQKTFTHWRNSVLYGMGYFGVTYGILYAMLNGTVI